MGERDRERETFGDLLRRFRTRAGLNSSELAQAVGAARLSVRAWEQGSRVPRDRARLEDLAEVLKLSSAEAAQLAGAARSYRPQPAAALPPTEAAGEVDSTPPSLPALRHQLRTPLPDFVGQQVAITTLLAALRQATTGEAAAISAVRGMGGSGKTELAYLVANRLTGSFPDAQIVVHLRGTSASALPPQQALRQVIHAFMPEATLPDELERLQARYHSVLHGQRALILADDAASAAQVRALLPPSGCALLVTSRMRFVLPGMTAIDLEQFSVEEALTLLHRICARLSDEEAQALAQVCGYLPLALRVAGGIMQADPALDVATYLAHLADERQRLSLLRDPDEPQLDVAAALTLSYAQLDGDAQRVFRQLGVLVADFTTELALAVVAPAEGVDVEATLHQLLRRNLLMYDDKQMRWRLHDLLRDLAGRELEAAGEQGATAWRYARAATGLAEQLQEQYLVGGESTLLALSAFDAERPHIDAARRWAAAHSETPDGDQLLLDIVLATRFIGDIRYDQRHEIIPRWEEVRMAARRLNNRVEEARALSNLGTAYYSLGELQTALSYHQQDFAIARELDDRRGQGITLGNLGILYASLGQPGTAITYYTQALAIARESGDPRSEGITLNNLGLAYAYLGETSTAIGYLKQRLVVTRKVGDRHGEGVTLGTLGNAYTDLGDLQHAFACCAAALTIARAIEDRRGEGYVLSYLARAQALQGERVLATTTLEQAMAIFQEVGDRFGEAEGQWYFGLALVQQGEQAQGLPLLRAALAYEEEIGHAKAAEHAALIARLEAGKEMSSPISQRAVGDDEETSRKDNALP